MGRSFKTKYSDREERLSYRQIATLMVLITMISKVLGFIREILTTKYFGASGETDAYFFALSMTSFFSVYLVSAINTTFIPVLADADADKNTDTRRVYANIFNIVVVISMMLLVVGLILVRPLTHLLAGGIAAQDANTFELTVILSRIAMLNLLFPGVIGVMTGFLRYNRSFLSPAMIGIPLNAVYYIYLIIFSDQFGVVGLIWASVLASFTQILILIPSLRRRSFRLTPVLDIKDPHVSKMARLSVPILFSTIIAEASIVIDKGIASWLPPGSITYLQYGYMIGELFISIFITTIATMDFPTMSKAYTANEPERAHRIIVRSFRIVILLMIPVAIFLFFFAEPVLTILFQRNKFTHEHTLITASVLSMYCVGMPAAAFRVILFNAFHANKDTKTPVVYSFFFLLVYFGFSLALFKSMGVAGIAIASSVSILLAAFFLARRLQQKENFRILHKPEYILILKTLLASALCFAFMKLGLHFTEGMFTFTHGESIRFIAFSLLAGLLFLATGYLLQIKELKAIFLIVKRKFLKA